ncbi:secretion protein HlyD, partial [Streptococcus pneumoniae]|nr:secretion protein HlyD [Streptococcus pneumoniae]
IQDEYTKLNKITAERNQLDADLQTLQNELIQLQQQGDSPSLSDTTSADDKAKLETKISEITTKIEALKTNITSKNSEIDSQQSNIKDMNRTYNNPTSQ